MGVVARWGVCVAVCAALFFPLFTMQSPEAAQSVLLDAVSTRVTLARDGQVDEVRDERIIRSGDTVATDPTGHAVVTYPDGSTALLEESSELTIEFVRTTAGEYVVRMQQTLGRVWYAVTKTVASGGRYEVHSAAMASVIRAGSGSLVVVTPGGETTVVSTAGSVETTAGGVAVTLPAGAFTTMTSAGATPLPLRPATVLTPLVPEPNSARSSPTPETLVATLERTLAATTTTEISEPLTVTSSPLPVTTAAARTEKTSAASPTTTTAPTVVATRTPPATTTQSPAVAPSPQASATPSLVATANTRQNTTQSPAVAPSPQASATLSLAATANTRQNTTTTADVRTVAISSTASKDQYGPRKDAPGQPAPPPQPK
jgi:hypothetical protein